MNNNTRIQLNPIYKYHYGLNNAENGCSRTTVEIFWLMLDQLRHSRDSFPVRSRGSAASEVLTTFRRDHVSLLQDALTETISQVGKLSSLTSALSVQKLQRATESYLRFTEEHSDNMHLYLESAISDFAKNLSAGDCFFDAFNSRATVNTAVAHLHDRQLRDVADFDRLGYAVDQLSDELADLEISAENFRTSQTAMLAELAEISRMRSEEAAMIGNLREEISRLRAATTIPDASLEDFQEKAQSLKREQESTQREIRQLTISRNRIIADLANTRSSEHKLHHDIARIIS